MSTGSFGTPSAPLAKLFTERVVLVERTSDPSSPAKGAIWFRSDLDSGTDKFGEVRWHDGSATNSVPVFDKGTSGSGVQEVLGIKTTNGIGYIPTADRADAAYPQMSLRHSSNDLGLHDAQTVVPVVEGFEDNDIAEYGADTSAFSTQSTTVFNGSYALRSQHSTNGNLEILSTNFSVSSGNTYRVQMRLPTLDVAPFIIFGVQDETDSDGYAPAIEGHQGDFTLFELSGGSASILADDTSVSLSTDIWYEVEFDWGSSGGLTATLFDDTGTQVSQISASDSTYSSGGIGWRMFNATTNSRKAYYDYLRKI